MVPTDCGPLGRPRHGAGLADVLDTARLPRLIDRHSDGGERRLKDPAAMTAAAQPTADAAGADRGRAAALQSESGSELTADSCTGAGGPTRYVTWTWGGPTSRAVSRWRRTEGRFGDAHALSQRVDERSHGRSAVTPAVGR
ncbi:hypothetical protein [Streptomyces sp. NBC_01614]|uniref:Uncharacterized protein n=1 Tax=Streptomyces machairae TaxID=3134109 RepID=A0ABU8UJJ6_9ACTN